MDKIIGGFVLGLIYIAILIFVGIKSTEAERQSIVRDCDRHNSFYVDEVAYRCLKIGGNKDGQ